MKPNLLLYCQHSVGIGHLVRSFAIVDKLKDEFNVTFMSGGVYPEGLPIPKDIEFIQLPALGLNKNNLLESGSDDTPAHIVMSNRRSIILETLHKLQPKVLITEYFPFGRIQFMSELLPLLKSARKLENGIKIFTSLRDILEPNSTKKKTIQTLSISVVNQYYDAILVHSDPNLITLSDSFPIANKIKVPILYTGYVTKSSSNTKSGFDPLSETITLSLGGGKIGVSLAKLIFEAYVKFGFGTNKKLLIITGSLFPENEWLILKRKIARQEGVTIKRSVPLLTALWKTSRMSISMGGYNTTMELLSSKIPALIIPYVNETNSEQKLRTDKLADMGFLKTIEMNASLYEISQAVKATLEFVPHCIAIDNNGDINTKEIILNCIAEKETIELSEQPSNKYDYC